MIMNHWCTVTLLSFGGSNYSRLVPLKSLINQQRFFTNCIIVYQLFDYVQFHHYLAILGEAILPTALHIETDNAVVSII